MDRAAASHSSRGTIPIMVCAIEHHSGCILCECYPLELCNPAILSINTGLESGLRGGLRAKTFYLIE